MTVMITGAAGFIGGYLARKCWECGCPVLGIDIQEPQQEWAEGSFERCDVRDEQHLQRLISTFRPERVFHLAAQSYPTVSLIEPRLTMDTNVGGTVNLFECLRATGIKPIVVVACSSAEYGSVERQNLPVRETHALSPLHPYGVSKVAQDLLAAQYFINYAMPTIRIRIFNTTGPGKLGDVCSDLTKRAIEIEAGLHTPELSVGNLDNRRAIADVRDLARGLWLSAEHCKAGEVYNLGGTVTYSVQELIAAIRGQLNTNFTVRQHSDLMRAFDEAVILGDITKFQSCCEWAPEIPLSTTLKDMLAWWRRRLVGQPTEPQRSTG